MITVHILYSQKSVGERQQSNFPLPNLKSANIFSYREWGEGEGRREQKGKREREGKTVY